MADWGAGATTSTVLLIAASDSAAGEATLAIEASGARLAATIDFAAVLPDLSDADLVVVEAAGADADALGAVLDLIAHHAAQGRAAIVAFAEPQLDLVAAAMLGTAAQLLCAPTAADRAAALAIALAGRGGARLREEDPDSAAERLARLNAEIARIADILAQLTRAEQRPAALADRTPSFRTEDDDAPVTAAEIRRAIRVRRLRDQFFGAGLFEDPAWDMLLDLFAADLEGTRVSVSSLCIAAAVAPTTALRWIGRMTDAGMIERAPDPGDRRRAFMLLSPGVRDDMRRYWQAMRRLGGALV